MINDRAGLTHVFPRAVLDGLRVIYIYALRLGVSLNIMRDLPTPGFAFTLQHLECCHGNSLQMVSEVQVWFRERTFDGI